MNDILDRLIDACWMVADSQTSDRYDESVAEMIRILGEAQGKDLCLPENGEMDQRTTKWFEYWRGYYQQNIDKLKSECHRWREEAIRLNRLPSQLIKKIEAKLAEAIARAEEAEARVLEMAEEKGAIPGSDFRKQMEFNRKRYESACKRAEEVKAECSRLRKIIHAEIERAKKAEAERDEARAEADRLRKELEELQIQLDACTEIKEGRTQALEHWCQRAWAAETDYDRIKDEAMRYVRERNEARDRERKLWDCLNAIYAPDFDSLPTPIPGCGHAVRNEDLDALCKVLGLEEE